MKGRDQGKGGAEEEGVRARAKMKGRGDFRESQIISAALMDWHRAYRRWWRGEDKGRMRTDNGRRGPAMNSVQNHDCCKISLKDSTLPRYSFRSI